MAAAAVPLPVPASTWKYRNALVGTVDLYTPPLPSSPVNWDLLLAAITVLNPAWLVTGTMTTFHHSGRLSFRSKMRWLCGVSGALSSWLALVRCKIGLRTGYSADRSIVAGWSMQLPGCGHCRPWLGLKPSGTGMYSGSCDFAPGGSFLYAAPPSHPVAALLGTAVSQ